MEPAKTYGVNCRYTTPFTCDIFIRHEPDLKPLQDVSERKALQDGGVPELPTSAIFSYVQNSTFTACPPKGDGIDGVRTAPNAKI